MSNITTRSGKGSALTHEELDANFSNLNTDKLENITSESIGSLSDVDITSTTNGYVLTYNSTSGNIELQAAAGGGASTGDWVFTDGIAANTNGYTYTTARPKPYLLGIGNADFTTNDLDYAAIGLGTDLTVTNNNQRMYGTTIYSKFNYDAATTGDGSNGTIGRARAINLKHDLVGEDQETIRLGDNASHNIWTRWTGGSAGTERLNWLGSITTYADVQAGGADYVTGLAFRNNGGTPNSATVNEYAGISFQGSNGNDAINYWYGIHNQANDGTRFSNQGNYDSLRASNRYFLIRNDDNFAGNKMGMITQYHEECDQRSPGAFSGTIGKNSGGDIATFENTTHIQVTDTITITGFQGLYTGETITVFVNGANKTKTKNAVDTLTIVFEQDSTGGHTITLPTGSAYKYANGNSTVGTTANSVTIVTVTAADYGNTGTPTYLISVSPEFVGS